MIVGRVPMRWRHLEFFFRETGANLWRQRFAAAAAAVSMAAAVLVVGASALAMLNVNRWVGAAGGELQVWVHLRPIVSRERAQELRSEIARWPQVSSCKLVTREEALRQLQETIKHPALNEVPNPLGDALKINARRPTYLPSITARLRRMREAETVIDAGEAQHWVATVARVVKGGTVFAGSLLVVVAVAVFSNTMRLSLFARRREIAIMQLVGATGSFVATPFVLEGLVLGLIGSGIAAVALLAGYAWAVDNWPAMALHLSLVPARQAAVLAGSLIGAGGLLGLLSGAVSVSRYLRRHLAGEVSF